MQYFKKWIDVVSLTFLLVTMVTIKKSHYKEIFLLFTD